MRQCKALNADKSVCQRHTRSQSGLCWQHENVVQSASSVASVSAGVGASNVAGPLPPAVSTGADASNVAPDPTDLLNEILVTANAMSETYKSMRNHPAFQNVSDQDFWAAAASSAVRHGSETADRKARAAALRLAADERKEDGDDAGAESLMVRARNEDELLFAAQHKAQLEARRLSELALSATQLESETPNKMLRASLGKAAKRLRNEAEALRDAVSD